MQKGQAVVGVFVLLIAGIIGLVVLTSLTNTFCGCTDAASITDHGVNSSDWQNHTCAGTKCSSGYTLTCNGTQLTPGKNYSINNCDYRIDDAGWTNATCVLHYQVEGSNYNTGILGTIVCLLPVLVALALLTGAIAWVALK